MAKNNESVRGHHPEIAASDVAEYLAAQGKGGKGLVCPDCGCRQFSTDHTRPDDGSIRRERRCRNCGAKLVTFER
jgi:hypothetical protein